MQKFSPSQLGIISEFDNILRIRVVVSDLNSEFQFFSEVNSEYSDNSEFFFELIRSIRTIPNFFRAHSDNSELISELYAEKIWKFIKITKIFFFLIRKSLNTPNSIFRANIRNLLLRAPTHGTYISTPLSMVF